MSEGSGGGTLPRPSTLCQHRRLGINLLGADCPCCRRGSRVAGLVRREPHRALTGLTGLSHQPCGVLGRRRDSILINMQHGTCTTDTGPVEPGAPVHATAHDNSNQTHAARLSCCHTFLVSTRTVPIFVSCADDHLELSTSNQLLGSLVSLPSPFPHTALPFPFQSGYGNTSQRASLSGFKSLNPRVFRIFVFRIHATGVLACFVSQGMTLFSPFITLMSFYFNHEKAKPNLQRLKYVT